MFPRVTRIADYEQLEQSLVTTEGVGGGVSRVRCLLFYQSTAVSANTLNGVMPTPKVYEMSTPRLRTTNYILRKNDHSK